jgi:Putative peptidoglycan binding domain
VPEKSLLPLEVYKETGLTIRYYGAVRYVLLPVFLTATAAIVAQYARVDNTLSSTLLAVCGLTLSCVFLIFEWSLSNNLKKLWGVTKSLLDKAWEDSTLDPIPHRQNDTFISFQRAVLHVPYVLTALYWVALLFVPVDSLPNFLQVAARSCLGDIRQTISPAVGYESAHWVTVDYRHDAVDGSASATFVTKADADSRLRVNFDCKTRSLLALEKLAAPGSGERAVAPPLDIAALQKCLREGGQRPGPVDGIFGPRTLAALRTFQSQRGMPASGLPEESTRNAMRACLERSR